MKLPSDQNTLTLASMPPMDICPVAYYGQTQPQHCAIKTDSSSLSYHTLNLEITALSQQLKQRIPDPASLNVIAMLTHQVRNTVLMLLACLRLGYVLCPISTQLPTEEILQRCQNAGIKYLVDEQSLLSETSLQQAGIQPLKTLFKADFSHASTMELTQTTEPTQPTQPARSIDPEQPFTAVFTSGSSGQAKAVLHSVANHYFSALGSQQVIPLHRQHTWLLSLPLHHIAGIALVMRTLLAGSTLAISEWPLATALSRHQVTHASLVPTQVYRLLAKLNPSSALAPLALQHVLIGGAALPQALQQALKQQTFNSYVSYGLTEMSSQVATLAIKSLNTSQGSSPLQYQLLPYRQMKTAKAELLLRGQTLCLGYLRADGVQKCTDDAGWFHSKDLGEVSGALVKVYGRKDNMFIAGGENVQPEDIEQCLLNHPEVQQVVVVAVNDLEFGQVPCAFIKWQAQPHWPALKQFSQQHLAPWQKPKHYLALPEQQGIKPQRSKLQQLAEQSINNDSR